MEQLFHFHTGTDSVIKVNGNPFDCSILLKNMYNVESVSLESVEMAHGFYNIRSPINTFTVDGISYSVPEGNYTIDTLLAAMSSSSGYVFEKDGDRINEYKSVAPPLVTYGFNTAYAAPYQTISDGGLTVTGSQIMSVNRAEPTMLSLYAIQTQKVMFSVKAGYVPNLPEFTCVGLASNVFINAGFTTTYLGGGDGLSSVAFWEDGAYYSAAGLQGQGFTSGFTTGDIIDLAIDTRDYSIQFRVNGGSWTLPQDISFMSGQGPFYFGVSVYAENGANGSMTLQTTAMYRPPAGYRFISPIVQTKVQWDPAFAAPHQYLTNSNEILTAFSNIYESLVHPSMITNYPINDGSKLMFSIKMNTINEFSYKNDLGIGNNDFKNHDCRIWVPEDNPSNCAVITQFSGQFYNLNVDGAPTGLPIPGWKYGDIVDTCVDTINYLIWWRVNGGPWTSDSGGISYPDNAGPTWTGPGDPANAGGGAYFAYLNAAPPYYLVICLGPNCSATLLDTANYSVPAGFTFIPAFPPGILTVTPNSLLNLLGYSLGNPSGTSTQSYSFPFDKYLNIWMENIGTSSNENQKITYKVPISSSKTFWTNNSFNKQLIFNQNSQFPLNRLNVQVLDQFGNKIDNNFLDWSFTLKVRGHRYHHQ